MFSLVAMQKLLRWVKELYNQPAEFEFNDRNNIEFIYVNVIEFRTEFPYTNRAMLFCSRQGISFR